MSELFLSILNMSLTASYVIIFIMLIRLPLKKAPKFISYALWGAVAFRLIIPFSFESMFSLMPRNTNGASIPRDIIYQQSPQVNSGIEMVDSFVNQLLPIPATGASVNPLQIYIEIGAYIWVLGIVALLVYSFVSIYILKKQLKNSDLIEGNIYEAKNLKTPFVLGVIKPNIYLPAGLKNEERDYILLHEKTHIHRKDHVIKIVAFFILSIHWFNPLVWIAFILMSRDMEFSCDERVLKEMNEDVKKPYANSLLSLATGRHILSGSPLAFSEGNVKGRIKNVMNYKKPTFWVVVFAVILVAGVTIGLLSNPTQSKQDLSMLNIDNLAKISYQRDKLLVSRAPLINEGFNVSAQAIAEYLDSVKWTEKKMSSPLELSADLQIEWNEDQELRFYESEPLLAMVRMNDQWIYYTIGKNDYEKILSIVEMAFNPQSMPVEIGFDVESNLSIIMSSPKTSSNPQDYINAHKNEYENFMKYGGEDALQYMLAQFETDNAEGLRGQIMMLLCKELLGARNNVTDKSLSPQEWYDALTVRQEIKLPNFKYDGQDIIEKLVNDTEIERESVSNHRGGFIIAAPKIFGSYEEGGLLKVFITNYSIRYKLYGSTLSKEDGGVWPAAITYRKDSNGKYILEKYEQAKDGSEFVTSIRNYCTMPISEKKIKGLADKILNHYGDYEDIRILHFDNLYEHLKKNDIKDATITDSQGEVEFFMNNPKYSQ